MTTPTSSLLLPRANRAQGTVVLPGSKSISNRMLLLAALATGTTRLTGLLDSDDTRYMMQALRDCGIQIESPGAEEAIIHGNPNFPNRQAEIFLGNAGTAMRSLTGALAVLGGDFTLSGIARMHQRPIGDLVTALRALGADIRYLGEEGYPPLRIGKPRINVAQPVVVKGDVSSQFLSALLMAAPLCAQAQPVIIDVEGELISRPYINITLNCMAQFGVVVEQDGPNRFVIPAQAQYRTPGAVAIEGDASSASYFLALGLLGGGPVDIQGVGSDSVQGDVAFADVVTAMGATVEQRTRSMTVTSPGVQSGLRLTAFDRDFNLIPDAAMTAAALAMFADGPCTLRNIGSWRVKETDRIHAMHTELEKLGATVASGPDWLRVHPIDPQAWQSARIATYDDHRMAMCFSLASFAPVAVTIEDPMCVGKTFPEYFSVFSGLIR